MVAATSMTTAVAFQGSHRLDEIVQQLRDVCRLGGIERALRIGKIVVDGCFNEDVAALRHKRKLPVSYRKLAQRPDLPISASALNRAVGVYELAQREPWLVASKKLSLAHLEAILPVREGCQAELLRDAEACGMSVRALRALLREMQGVSGGNRGRPPLHPAQRLLKCLNRLTDNCHGMLGKCEQLGVERAVMSRLQAALSDLSEACERLDVELAPLAKPSREVAA